MAHKYMPKIFHEPHKNLPAPPPTYLMYGPLIKMDQYLKIKNTPLKDFDIRCCIISQKKDSQGLASTVNGRSKLMEAARIREDEVWNLLQSTCAEEPFVHHVDNQCYKKYVLKKTLENIMVLDFVS